MECRLSEYNLRIVTFKYPHKKFVNPLNTKPNEFKKNTLSNGITKENIFPLPHQKTNLNHNNEIFGKEIRNLF